MKKVLIILALVFIAATPFVSAAQDFIPLTNLPGINEAATSETLPAFFNNLYKLCIGAAAVIAILQIMRAGTYFMFNKGSVAHNEKGKSMIMNAILGLLLVLSPAIVFGIINPDILNLKLDLTKLSPPELEVDPTVPMNVKIPLAAFGRTVTEDDIENNERDRFNAFRTACAQAGGRPIAVKIEPPACTAFAPCTAQIRCVMPSEEGGSGSSAVEQSSSQPDTETVMNNEYEWFLIIQNETGGQISTSEGEWNEPGPRKRHATQAACRNDLNSFMERFYQNHPTWAVKEVRCSCEQPRSTYAACRN